MSEDNRRKGNWWGVSKNSSFNRRRQEVRGHDTSWALNNLEALQYLDQLETPATIAPVVNEQSDDSEQVSEHDSEQVSTDEIERSAFFDLETAAYNFRYTLGKLRRELSRSKRYKRPLSVCVINMDGLKNISRDHSVVVAKEGARSAAAAIIHMIRADVDMLGRYGDDHFILIIPETPGHGASIVAERIRKKIETIEIRYQWYVLNISASIGISYYPGHGEFAEELIAHADIASDFAQQRGGNRFWFAPEHSDNGLATNF
jgi:diguanylate cyclase (GGDEF)-like protein